MNRKIILPCLLLSLLGFACNPTTTVPQTEIDLNRLPTVELQAESRPLDSVLWAPDCIFAFDDYVIVEEGKRSTGLFQCFDAQSLDFRFACGTRGKGPNELLNPLGTYVVSNDSTFSLLDNGIEKEFRIVDKHLVLTRKAPIVIYDAVNGLTRIGRDRYFMNGRSDGSEPEHLFYDDGHIIDCGHYPESPYEDHRRFILEFKTNAGHIDGDTIYSFYNNRNLIRKYTPDGRLLEESYLSGKECKTPDYDRYHSGQASQFFGSSCMGDSVFLIAFYDGVPNATVYAGDYDPEFLLWRWDTGVQCRLKLDRRYQRPAFTLSEKLHRLYVLDLQQPDRIDTYDLNSVL